VDFGITAEQKVLIQRVDRLVKECIAPRAAHYDLALEAPREDIQQLHREGWLLANLDRKRGGLGYGLYGDDPLAFFLLDEHLAYGQPLNCTLLSGSQQCLDDDYSDRNRGADRPLDRTHGQTRRVASRLRCRTPRSAAQHRNAGQGRISGERHEALCDECNVSRVVLDRQRGLRRPTESAPCSWCIETLPV
jgi:hypothetical protein